jgi:hypothetical protein
MSVLAGNSNDNFSKVENVVTSAGNLLGGVNDLTLAQNKAASGVIFTGTGNQTVTPDQLEFGIVNQVLFSTDAATATVILIGGETAGSVAAASAFQTKFGLVSSGDSVILKLVRLGDAGATVSLDDTVVLDIGEDLIYVKVAANSVTSGAESLTISAASSSVAIGTVTVANYAAGGTLSTLTGIVTITDASLAVVTSAGLTITNTLVTATSAVFVTIEDFAGVYGTNGIPVVAVDSIGAGSFKIQVTNAHAANAIGAVALIVAFHVVN